MTEMIRCPACGTSQSFDARFCSECGASLGPATGSTTRLAAKVCPNCRAPLREHTQFCSECGQRVGNDSVSHPPAYPHPQARDRQGTRAMMCPICRDVPLQMTERQGIEIEYCPACRGVWLDRGELDKIIERAAPAQGRSTSYPTQRQDRDVPAYPQQRRHNDDDDYRRKKKRGGFLDELFDFD